MKKNTEKLDEPLIVLSKDTISKGKQALIFLNTKMSAEKSAEDIAREIGRESEELISLSEEVLHDLPKPTTQCERLARCIRKGVAYHHAGLTHKQKEMIEDGFRNRVIKIICATPTLAYGISAPAFRSIIKGLHRYEGRFGMSWIPVLDYLQMAGRAGRPEYDKTGEAILVASTDIEAKKIFEKYILGQVEPIYSKLAVEPVLRTYLLSLIATQFVLGRRDIMRFFQKTFWAYQFQDMTELNAKIEKMLNLLEKWKFIVKKSPEDEFVSASRLEEEKDIRFEATRIGRRVAELYIDPLTANHFIDCMEKKKKLNEFSLLQMVSMTLELRPLLRYKTKEFDELQEKIAKFEEHLLVNEPSLFEPEYEEFMNSIKTALFFFEWIEEKDEDYLLKQYGIRPGETRVKLITADWLLYACEEFSKLSGKKDFLRAVIKMRIRLKYGVKEELLALLKLKAIGRARARKLFSNGIKDIGDVKKVDLMTLSQLIGRETAIKVKEQVGQEVDVVKEGKRKGQVSLRDFDEGF